MHQSCQTYILPNCIGKHWPLHMSISLILETLNFMVLMYPPQINRTHALIIILKPVGSHITFWRINTTKSDTCGWEVKLMLFNVMVTQVLLYGVEVKGGTISRNAWNEIKKIEKLFLSRQLGMKCTTSYEVMLLETSV